MRVLEKTPGLLYILFHLLIRGNQFGKIMMSANSTHKGFMSRDHVPTLTFDPTKFSSSILLQTLRLDSIAGCRFTSHFFLSFFETVIVPHTLAAVSYTISVNLRRTSSTFP